MLNNKAISVVIGTYNRKKYLKLTINSIRIELKEFRDNYEIIVVDGGSSDGSLRWLMKQKDIITIIQYNRGKWLGKEIERRSWGYFMNLGFKCAQGKYICMLSDDCLVVPMSIRNGYKRFERELSEGRNIGALAFYWRNWPEQKKYLVGITLDNKMFVNHGLFLRKALGDVDYIDEETYSFYHADGDLCLKFWNKGYKVIDSPDSYIEHYSHANIKIRASNLEKQKMDWENYLLKWKTIYPEIDNGKIGYWIQSDYTDHTNTAILFKKISLPKSIIYKT